MSSPSAPTWWQRYTTELVVLAVGLVLVVGLWVRNRPDDGPTALDPGVTTTVAETATTQPVAADEADDEPVEPVAEGEGSSSLSKAVLRSSDLPRGWSPLKAAPGATELCPGRDPFSRVPPASTARAAFSDGSGGSSASGLVARYSGSGDATALLAAVREDGRGCGGSGSNYAVSSLSGVGDEAVKVTIALPIGAGTLRTLIVLARDGEHVAMVALTGEPDEALAVRALKAQLGRL